MNDHKICFIICSNDELATRECILYISHLTVPDGFEVQVLTVTEAKSMTAGYNEGMAQTDAKYKVYLHQDVYLVNCHFIEDILKIFTENSQVGMIGMIGNASLAEDGGAWSDGMWRRVGKVYLDMILKQCYSLFKNVTKPYEEVVVLDGLLMATQYDLPWRDDLFTGWDFYDCSQSLEFIRNGYKVVVPYMDKPWCLHDNDVLNLAQYDMWRRVFVREYYEDYMKWNREHEKVSDDNHSDIDIQNDEKKYSGSGENIPDESKVLFVICSNNELYLEECLWFISKLYVPDGIVVDAISIPNAQSITQAYNEAMHSSNAKYKIYLHQDVFIYNENFIADILRVFQSEAKIGMLGVIGGNRLSDEAMMWNCWNLGKTYACDYKMTGEIKHGQKDELWTEAVALDGMLLATQYDLQWRDDLGMKWDGYDISQSLEFKRKGYLLAVPYQETPWCMHDCGPSDLSNYDRSREILMKEYSEFFGGVFKKLGSEELNVYRKKLLDALEQNILLGRYEEVTELLNSCNAFLKLTKGIRLASNILEICMAEKERNADTSIFLHDIYDWNDLVDKYERIKFMLRRVECNGDEETLEILLNLISERLVSGETFQIIAKYHLLIPEKFLPRLV